MSNVNFSQLTAFSGSVDGSADLLALWQTSSSTLFKITRNQYLNLSSAPLGLTDSQSPQNKTFDNTNVLTIKTGNLTLQSSSDVTKQAKFSAASITAGQTRTFTLPDVTDTIVTLTATQTLTNKTLTSPTLNTPTLTNATISADTITGYSSSTTGSIYGMSVTSGVLASAALNNAVNTAAIQSAAVTNAKVASGFVVQRVSTNYSAVATGTTTIPYDDTIPQSSEGDQYMSQAITPLSSTNRLIIEATVFVASSVANNMVVTLFQDSGTNAIAVASNLEQTGNGQMTIPIRFEMAAGTTSSTTFKIRAGGNNAGTTTFNGASGGRLFGTAPKSNITITEVTA